MSKKMPNFLSIINQIKIIGFRSISVILLGAYFVSIVYTIQIIKEFMNFNASAIIGNTLANVYTKELCPVITAIILTGKVASAFTAEIAVMKVTKQLDIMYMLHTNPVKYIITPRLFACCIVLPLLNIIAFFTSLTNSLLISTLLYQIPAVIFLQSIHWSVVFINSYKSLIKSISFALIISLISCYFGFTAVSDAKGVGAATTSSVVTILMLIFITNFVLTTLLF